MASEIITMHPETPELRKIKRVAEALKAGAVILFPVDTGFSLGCQLSNKEAIRKLRRIRRLSDKKALTFLCHSLSNIAEFAKVSNSAYRIIKGLIPGPYTFVMPASRQVPKFAQNPKRKTAGIRVPDNELAQLLLEAVGEPIISITAKKSDDQIFVDPDEVFDLFSREVDIAVRLEEYQFSGESTVVDMITDDFSIMREGAGIDEVLECIY
ncbi:MAG: L-threonylcarbamoyladenylate synthase [Candidatus Kapabacteria bacterium]|jgi:tRNA threonylcarbamoyl adenosine modification protein (Sua5/YciO/YrdC/YwlC family)|nr:L-threonylcarbamoyladenylate synthase [Candidatus Kapabacteria bacterium]